MLGYDVKVSEVTPSSPSNPSVKPKPSRGAGAAIGGALAAFTGALVSITGKIFGQVRERGGVALADFRARPEHSRWRVYTLGCYGLIVAGTLVAQTYTKNSLDAYVRVQPVELPALTQIFVRNDSKKTWSHVKITLNGIYGFEQPELQPGLFIMLPVNKFAVYDSANKPTFAPKNIVPKDLTIDTADAHFETDLHE
jgi:hypothetical protein